MDIKSPQSYWGCGIGPSEATFDEDHSILWKRAQLRLAFFRQVTIFEESIGFSHSIQRALKEAGCDLHRSGRYYNANCLISASENLGVTGDFNYSLSRQANHSLVCADAAE